MYNNYTVTVDVINNRIEANLFINLVHEGKIFCPNNTLNTKEEWIKFLTSLSGIVYGQENKAAKEQESICSDITSISIEDYLREEK